MREKKLVDAKESQDECYHQARDSMVERRLQARLAWWEILLGHLDESLRGALRQSSEGEEDASERRHGCRLLASSSRKCSW